MCCEERLPGGVVQAAVFEEADEDRLETWYCGKAVVLGGSTKFSFSEFCWRWPGWCTDDGCVGLSLIAWHTTINLTYSLLGRESGVYPQSIALEFLQLGVSCGVCLPFSTCSCIIIKLCTFRFVCLY